jgi:hypothetical protein
LFTADTNVDAGSDTQHDIDVKLFASYRKMKWYTKLSVWGSVASVIALCIVPFTCSRPNTTASKSIVQNTEGNQSPIVTANGNVKIQYSNMGSNESAQLVRNTVSEVLNQMDTNRVLVDQLAMELQEEQKRGKVAELELGTTKSELSNALATIANLQSKLTNTTSLAALSPTERERVNQTSNSVQRAVGTMYVKDLRVGTLIIH